MGGDIASQLRPHVGPAHYFSDATEMPPPHPGGMKYARWEFWFFAPGAFSACVVHDLRLPIQNGECSHDFQTSLQQPMYWPSAMPVAKFCHFACRDLWLQLPQR